MLFALAALALVIMVVLPVGRLVGTTFSGPHGATACRNTKSSGRGLAALMASHFDETALFAEDTPSVH